MILQKLLFVVLLFPIALAQDAGLPLQNPTISYWQTPPNKDVADLQSSKLPDVVDVVIIGSGMTGTSAARHLLKSPSSKGPLKIAMVEARQACSGATGRNGGQITTASFAEYEAAKGVLSPEEAAKLTRLRAQSAAAMMDAASEMTPEGRDAAEVRLGDCILALFSDDAVAQAVAQLNVLKKEVPDIGSEWMVLDKLQMATMFPNTVGGLVGSPKISGSLWPYRFVTHMLKELLDAYPTFSLDTHTPVLNISTVQDNSQATNSSDSVFIVNTGRGSIRTRHVIHAENAWVPHLVPGLQGKISGGRLHMSAQLAGAGIPRLQEWAPIWPRNDSSNNTVFRTLNMDGDYAVQLPKNGEFMLGGGGGPGGGKVKPVQQYDDSAPPDHGTTAYLDGALASYFGGGNWGSERIDFPQPDDPAVWKGRTKRVWTGIEAFSPDGRPVVGRLPTSVTTRPVAARSKGAEWISTGYDGEGMCFAYLCARTLASAILDYEASQAVNQTDRYPEWFPQSMVASEARIAAATAPKLSDSGNNTSAV